MFTNNRILGGKEGKMMVILVGLSMKIGKTVNERVDKKVDGRVGDN